MKQTIGLYEFRNAFNNSQYKDNFTYDGLELLFDYLETCDENMELDVCEIACDFEESDHDYIAKNYLDDLAYAEYKDLDFDDQANEIRAFLEQNTVIIGETGQSFVFAQF